MVKKIKQSKLVLKKDESDEEFHKIGLDEDWSRHVGKKVKVRQYKGTMRKVGSICVLEAEKKTPPLHDFPYKPPGRECPRRLLCSPYKGCHHNCKYCYAIHSPLYGLGTKNVVFTNYVEVVKKQIEKMPIVFPLYMSQDTDPFQQPIEQHYGITRELTEYFVNRHLPFEYITKNHSVVDILDITNGYDLYFIQLSIITLDEKIRKFFEPYASPINARFQALKEFSETGCFSIVRIDPILPHITDDKEMLRELFVQAKEYGANHIIASICDIGSGVWGRSLKKAVHDYGGDILTKRWRELYWSNESLKQGNWADEKYRIDLLTYLRKLAEKYGVTFAACQENVNRSTTGNVVNKHVLKHDLMTSPICEGKILPAVRRQENQTCRFEPIRYCTSDCLGCDFDGTPPCGLSQQVTRNYSRNWYNLVRARARD